MDFKKEYFSFWELAWKFHKKWSDNKGSDTEWEQIVDEAQKICKKHEDKPFIKSLVLAVLDELERVDKLKRKEFEVDGKR